MFCFVFSTSESDQLSFVVFFGIVSACAVIWIWPPAIQLRGAQIQGRPSKVCHAERVTEIEAPPIFNWILAVRRLRMIFFSKMMLFSFGDPKSTILTWPCRWINQHLFKTRSTKITHTMTLDFGLWILKVYKFLFWYSWGWWQLCGVSDIVSSNKSGRKGVVGDYDDDGIDDPDRQIFFSMSTPLLDANTFLYLDVFWTFSLLLIFVGQFSLTWKHRINNLLSVLEHLKQGCLTLIRSKGSLAGQARMIIRFETLYLCISICFVWLDFFQQYDKHIPKIPYFDNGVLGWLQEAFGGRRSAKQAWTLQDGTGQPVHWLGLSARCYATAEHCMP